MATKIIVKENEVVISGTDDPGVIEIAGRFLRVEKLPDKDVHVVGMRLAKTRRVAEKQFTRLIHPQVNESRPAVILLCGEIVVDLNPRNVAFYVKDQVKE